MPGCLNNLKKAFSTQSSINCLQLLKEITLIDYKKPLYPLGSDGDLKDPFAIKVMSSSSIARLEKSKERKKTLNECISLIYTYHSPEVLIEFFSKLPLWLQQCHGIDLLLNLPSIQQQLPYFLLSNVPSTSANAFYSYLSSYSPLRNKLTSDKQLLTHCINFYFEGKGEINKLLIPLFTDCARHKKSNHKKFEEFLELNSESEINSKSIPETEGSDPAVIWQKGVKSWRHYRSCRLQQENLKLQTVLDRLVSADLIFRGTSTSFSDHFDFDGAMLSAFQQAITCKSWIKIFNDQHWVFFINELKNVKDSPKISPLQIPLTTNKGIKEDLVGIMFDQSSGCLPTFDKSLELMRAIYIVKDTAKARHIAIERRNEIEQKFSINLPIVIYRPSSLQTLCYYTPSERRDNERTWIEHQKVNTIREPLSRNNVESIYQTCRTRSRWDLGLFGSRARLENRPVPKTVIFIKKTLENASQSNITWVEAEQRIKDVLIKKTTQNCFFKLCNGRSKDTANFYKSLISTFGMNYKPS